MKVKLIAMAVVIVVMAVAYLCRDAWMPDADYTTGSGWITSVNPGAIVVDGKPGDWAKIAPDLVEDLSGVDPSIADVMKELRESRGEGAYWKEISLAHDGTDLYFYFNLGGQVGQISGSGLDIYVDSDGSTSTGMAQTVRQMKAGFDRALRLRFKGGGGKGAVSCSVQEAVGRGWEEMSARASVGSAGNTLEISVPLDVLGITPPSEVQIYFEPLGFNDLAQMIKMGID